MLHRAEEERTLLEVLQSAELRSHGDVSNVASYEVAGVLNLCNHAVLSEDLVVEVVVCSESSDCTSSNGCRHESLSPVGRLASSEEDGCIDNLAEGFLHARLYFAPDVVLGVVKYCLRDGNDDGDLFCVDRLLVPCLGCGLLLLSVSVYEVRDRKRVKDRELCLLRCHVCELAAHGKSRRLLDGALDDLLRTILRDEGLSVSSENSGCIANRCGIVKKL